MDATCGDEQAKYLAGETTAAQHVAGCDQCAPALPSLDAVRTELADEAMWLEPSPALESRILAQTDIAATPQPPTPSPASSPHRWWLLLAAAFVLGVLTATGVTYAIHTAGPRTEARITLHATPLARSASATADLRDTTGGLRIDLHAHGLGRAPTGYFYQCWLKGPSGAVAIGTFHTGTSDIILWSGVPLNRYPTMTITLEPEDGNAASSGRVLLAGTVP